MNNNKSENSGDAIVARGVPPTASGREELFISVREVVSQMSIVPPIGNDLMMTVAEKSLKLAGLSQEYLKYAAVICSNEVWRGTLAAVPFDKRLLLLPRCLRDFDNCEGKIDQFGLLCAGCSRCHLQSLQSEAEALGYVVMIAEGSAVVMSLIESGQIEGIIGVSCLSVLEQVFPYMQASAIPGIAISLLDDGCRNTSVDLDTLRDAIYLSSDESSEQVDLKSIRDMVDSWFTQQSLVKILGPGGGMTAQVARQWLGQSGKRWRPTLTLSTCSALAGSGFDISDTGVKYLGVAVECFHKASLIHDDIEDDDDLRYGEQAVHAKYGKAFALNVGDFLLGEGYRLITESTGDLVMMAKMLTVAAIGHRTLCIGQGDELWWNSTREPISPEKVLGIFAKKTAPAFEVALRLGAIYAKSDQAKILGDYSKALGIAYQIRDDMDDFFTQNDSNDARKSRLSLILALATETTNLADRKLITDLWQGNDGFDPMDKKTACLLTRLNLHGKAAALLGQYKSQAIVSLENIDSIPLKSLLRRMIGKIFNDFKLTGCCR